MTEALTTEELTIEEQIKTFRSIAGILAAELVRDRSLRADCEQEAMIRVWEILTRQPGASRPYIHKSIKRRIMEVSKRQTWVGHTGRRGVPIDPLRRPHVSMDSLLEAGWEPTA
jgi:DNA-directed RNA polymerase specialized sigma24 family protein